MAIYIKKPDFTTAYPIEFSINKIIGRTTVDPANKLPDWLREQLTISELGRLVVTTKGGTSWSIATSGDYLIVDNVMKEVISYMPKDIFDQKYFLYME
jgi:hypothetical protein